MTQALSRPQARSGLTAQTGCSRRTLTGDEGSRQW